MVAAAVALGALTWRQAEVWRDPTSLWTHALATHPSAIAHYNLAVVILGRGQLADAVSHFHRALAIKPGLLEAQENLDQLLAGGPSPG